MKRIFIFLVGLLLLSFEGYAQSRPASDSIAAYFDEIKGATQENGKFWDYDLYGPLLLVQSDTRIAYANVADSAGVLKQEGSIFRGVLPPSVNIANTSIHWNGENWAMVMLPLPIEKKDRVQLLAHELFHRAQSRLLPSPGNADNAHLDQKKGRIYLRLELEALKAAVLANVRDERIHHITNALAFRKYRQSLFVGSAMNENRQELNEGMAELTGLMLSGRTKEQMRKHFVEKLKQFVENPSFVYSFAYQTVPMYGCLLYDTHADWNKDVSVKTDLTEYFLRAFEVQLPNDLRGFVTSTAGRYRGLEIIAEETSREAEMAKRITEYKNKFLGRPHLGIPLQEMNISFDPRNLVPLEGKGTVYPSIRVTDTWGILTVHKGALLNAAWNKIIVSVPTKIDEKKVEGDGWTLELKDGFAVRRDTTLNNYILLKR